MGERFVNIDGAILEEFFLDSVDCIQDEEKEEVVKVEWLQRGICLQLLCGTCWLEAFTTVMNVVSGEFRRL